MCAVTKASSAPICTRRSPSLRAGSSWSSGKAGSGARASGRAAARPVRSKKFGPNPKVTVSLAEALPSSAPVSAAREPGGSSSGGHGRAPGQVLGGGRPAQEQRGGASSVGTGAEVEGGHPDVLLAGRQDSRLVGSLEGDDGGRGCPAVAAERRGGDGRAAGQGRETASGEQGPPGDPSAGRRDRAAGQRR